LPHQVPVTYSIRTFLGAEFEVFAAVKTKTTIAMNIEMILFITEYGIVNLLIRADVTFK